MNIRYPVRKADGRDYKNYDELLTDIRKNAHGWWLLGISRYWHGGIHIGTSSSPASVLDQETPEKSVPLQFMMDGEVVAWRVNRDYAHIECMQAQSLRQSGTFVLVKSVYKPDEQDESSWLTLYQLYMHIAPLSEFPKRPLYRVTQKGHGVRMRKHSRHDDNREIVPDVLANKHGNARTLMQGETLAVLQQKSFLLDQRLEPFALVQRLQNGKPAGDLFWVSMRPEYLELDGECYVCLPDWMHSALNHGVFDDVVVPPVPLKVTVKAGDPVGFLGAQDLADEDNYPQIITTDYKAHIELLSLDEHVTDVVANVKGIKTGKQFIKLKLKRPLYLRNGEGEESTFEQMSAITRADAGKIIPRDATYPFTDKTGVTYFQIRPHTWVHQDDVEQLSQHDLAGLNFDCIKAEHTTDFTRTLDERWVIDALKSISSHFDSEKGPASAQAKMFYDSLIHNAENRRPPDPYPDKSQDELLFGALHTAFSFTGFRADSLDVQLVHGPPKLGMSFATGGVLIVHAKNTGFIAVQRQRFTMLINIMTCGFKVRKRGFRFDEQKLHDFTGCVINVDQCGAGWSSAFKPVMIAAIDLYQFARTRTPVTWLRDPCGAELQADITIEPLQR